MTSEAQQAQRFLYWLTLIWLLLQLNQLLIAVPQIVGVAPNVDGGAGVDVKAIASGAFQALMALYCILESRQQLIYRRHLLALAATFIMAVPVSVRVMDMHGYQIAISFVSVVVSASFFCMLSRSCASSGSPMVGAPKTHLIGGVALVVAIAIYRHSST